MNLPREIAITKVDPQGRATITYPGGIVYFDEQGFAARCAWTQPYAVDLGPFALEPDDVFIEFYYFHYWFNIYRIYDSLGRLKGWYCNITGPLEVLAQEVRWHDLALDLLVLPDGSSQVLDEDEFEELHPNAATRQQAREAIDQLRSWVADRKGPFAPCRWSHDDCKVLGERTLSALA